MSSPLVFPGQEIGLSSDYLASTGIYEKNGKLFSSLFGTLVITQENKTKTARVIHSKRQENFVTPTEGHVVIGKVTKINQKQANVNILVVDGKYVCHDPFKGIIRLTERDKVQMFKCLRPGDVVKAIVISLGDASAYFLSIAELEYGVICAQTESGEMLVPFSSDEMICPKTGALESRKVAKP
ncbi:Nucleic acid-binding domain-containing protein [Rozella allomycis CSF55]|uniref:Nucleic acid-binding domain-containing protein n=1 Tax=Rozella allomycis (strain CSF55) TaxID=988480 RepID=A0A075ANE3_ROZAC|nr:Nucleic acid-binding domain-containing protein [Rozella allomycis CSF55]|eukprot:EPZ31370.1 Nucleic acid-binding domain-containing protein [Rozella allomycis CSF55]